MIMVMLTTLQQRAKDFNVELTIDRETGDPINTRNVVKNIKEFYEKEREEAEKQQGTLKNKNKGKGDISRPNIAPKQPTYTTKAPKK